MPSPVSRPRPASVRGGYQAPGNRAAIFMLQRVKSVWRLVSRLCLLTLIPWGVDSECGWMFLRRTVSGGGLRTDRSFTGKGVLYCVSGGKSTFSM